MMDRLMDLCNSVYGGSPDEIALNLELLFRDIDDDCDLAEVADLMPLYLQRAKNNASK